MDISAVGIIVRNNKGEILILHRKNFMPEGNKWGLPGGKVRENLGPLKTAIYKAKAEAGLEFKDGELIHLGEFKFIDETGNDITFNTWVANITENVKEIKFDTNGSDGYKWEFPEVLVREGDLMVGMYPILRRYLGANQEPGQLPPN